MCLNPRYKHTKKERLEREGEILEGRDIERDREREKSFKRLAGGEVEKKREKTLCGGDVIIIISRRTEEGAGQRRRAGGGAVFDRLPRPARRRAGRGNTDISANSNGNTQKAPNTNHPLPTVFQFEIGRERRYEERDGVVSR